MKELIPITEQNGKRAVSARELHKFLEATERFSYWFERQSQYGFIEGVDYIGCKEFNTLANQTLDDYALTGKIHSVVTPFPKTALTLKKNRYYPL